MTDIRWSITALILIVIQTSSNTKKFITTQKLYSLRQEWIQIKFPSFEFPKRRMKQTIFISLAHFLSWFYSLRSFEARMKVVTLCHFNLPVSSEVVLVFLRHSQVLHQYFSSKHIITNLFFTWFLHVKVTKQVANLKFVSLFKLFFRFHSTVDKSKKGHEWSFNVCIHFWRRFTVTR